MGKHEDKSQEKSVEKPQKLSRLARVLEIPADVLKSTPHLEFSGNHELLVEGCLGILSFDTEEISFSAGKYSIKVTGKNLFIRNFTADAVLVSGTLTSVQFI